MVLLSDTRDNDWNHIFQPPSVTDIYNLTWECGLPCQQSLVKTLKGFYPILLWLLLRFHKKTDEGRKVSKIQRRYHCIKPSNFSWCVHSPKINYPLIWWPACYMHLVNILADLKDTIQFYHFRSPSRILYPFNNTRRVLYKCQACILFTSECLGGDTSWQI